jgi:hypothetical protein
MPTSKEYWDHANETRILASLANDQRERDELLRVGAE